MEKAPPNYYDILGIDINASVNEISKAFRKKAGPLHPDRNPGHEKEHEDEYIKLATIFETLKDPNKKAEYDLTLLQAKKQPEFIPKTPPAPQRHEYTTYHAPVHEKPSPPSEPEEEMPEGFKDSTFLTWAYNEADEDELKFIKDHAQAIIGVRNIFKNIFGRKK